MRGNLNPAGRKRGDTASSYTKDFKHIRTSVDTGGSPGREFICVKNWHASDLFCKSRLPPSDCVDLALRGLKAGYITHALGQALQYYGEGRLSDPAEKRFRKALFQDVPRLCAAGSDKFLKYWLFDAEVNLSLGGKYRRNLWGNATVEVIPSDEPEGVDFVGIDFRNNRPEDENWGKIAILEDCRAAGAPQGKEEPASCEDEPWEVRVVHGGEE